MQELNINELKPHSRNNEFFDDITGEKWNEFLGSIKARGVIEPVVITQDKIIVSGHQRVRACKELGIDSVMCKVHIYNSEDEILQDLLETNIRQRGDVGGSAKKVGKRIVELERLYGIRQGSNNEKGNNRIGDPNNSDDQTSQSDLAEKMGISVDTLNNYKTLASMIPELEELVDTGIVTKTTALAMMKELSEQEQEELISSLDTTKRITGKQMEKYIEEINYLKSHPVIEKPDDYDELKKQLNIYEHENKCLEEREHNKILEVQDLKKQINALKSNDSTEQYNKKLKDSVLIFCSKVNSFIEQVGGYVWLTQEINNLPPLEREGYFRAVNALKSWTETINI